MTETWLIFVQIHATRGLKYCIWKTNAKGTTQVFGILDKLALSMICTWSCSPYCTFKTLSQKTWSFLHDPSITFNMCFHAKAYDLITAKTNFPMLSLSLWNFVVSYSDTHVIILNLKLICTGISLGIMSNHWFKKIMGIRSNQLQRLKYLTKLYAKWKIIYQAAFHFLKFNFSFFLFRHFIALFSSPLFFPLFIIYQYPFLTHGAFDPS